MMCEVVISVPSSLAARSDFLDALKSLNATHDGFEVLFGLEELVPEVEPMTEDVYYPLIETEIYPKLLGDNLLESIEAKKRFLHEHGFRLQEAAHLCGLAIKSGNKIFIAGNGGSATDASHFAGEMLGRFVKERDALPCIFIGGDLAAMTAIANDYGYEYVFSRQLQGLAKPGDVFIGISTSGNSKNILNAASTAKSLSCNVIGLTGGDGGGLAGVSDYLLNVAGSTKTARIQETHIWALHCLAEMIEGFSSDRVFKKDSES